MALSNSRIDLGVPTPIVSPSDISYYRNEFISLTRLKKKKLGCSGKWLEVRDRSPMIGSVWELKERLSDFCFQVSTTFLSFSFGNGILSMRIC